MGKLHISIALILIGNSMASFSQCERKNTAFKDGDKLTFAVYYNVGFVWAEAGEVVFEAKKQMYKNKAAYHFRAVGKSLPAYDWVFRVRDYYDTYAEYETLKPQVFVRNTSEGNYKVNNTYFFDYTNKQILSKTSNSNQKLKDSILVMDKCYADLLTSFYIARSFDFSTFEIDKNVPFNVVIDNKAYTIYSRLKGYETVEARDGKKYECAKMAAHLMEGSMFKGGSEIYIYITNDKNKIPILIEAPILVGSIKVYLTKAENLLHPLQYTD